MNLSDFAQSELTSQAILTREEGTKMASEFNRCLTSFAVQVDELSKQNKILSEKFEKEACRNDSIRESISSMKAKIEKTSAEITQKSREFSELEHKIINEISDPVAKHDNFKDISSKDLAELDVNKIYEMCLKANLYFEKLEKASILLETREELLNKKVVEMNNKIHAELKCVNCGKSYVLTHNLEENCVFHPGSLRYFSCRGCGADAYYNCCTKCINCSPGCKVTTHSS